MKNRLMYLYDKLIALKKFDEKVSLKGREPLILKYQ